MKNYMRDNKMRRKLLKVGRVLQWNVLPGVHNLSMVLASKLFLYFLLTYLELVYSPYEGHSGLAYWSNIFETASLPTTYTFSAGKGMDVLWIIKFNY